MLKKLALAAAAVATLGAGVANAASVTVYNGAATTVKVKVLGSEDGSRNYNVTVQEWDVPAGQQVAVDYGPGKVTVLNKDFHFTPTERTVYIEKEDKTKHIHVSGWNEGIYVDVKTTR